MVKLATKIRALLDKRIALHPEKIKELEMEGAKISWDELVCVGYTVTEKAVKKLCRDMNERRKMMREQRGITGKLPVVTRTNLENWKVLKKTNDGCLASNAFVLLTSDYFPFSRTQCALFKGTDRSVFLDKREYAGPLYEQIDAALDFVLRNIRLGVKFEGIQRKEIYELPVDAIREMIVNAHCHRNLTDESCVQVAIYDDRLEVTSPGGLYNGLTFEEALQGHSRLRNRAVANVFRQIGLIEAWGTGLQRIQNAAREYGLPEAEFIEMPDTFRVNLYRAPLPPVSVPEDKGKTVIDGNNAGGMSVNDGGNVGENADKTGKLSMGTEGCVGERAVNIGEKTVADGDLKSAVLSILAVNNKASAAEIAKTVSVTQRTVERHIRALREEGKLIRHGSARGGYWEVKEGI